jgi:hypothetical protein
MILSFSTGPPSGEIRDRNSDEIGAVDAREFGFRAE